MGQIQDKSLQFAVHSISFYKYLCEIKNEYVISKQFLRCSTSIGANVRESKNAVSNADFINKLSIALKEADETQYWLEVLQLSEIISNEEFDTINNEVKELIALLTSIIKTSKEKNNLN
ncbi:MAG: four helix bundle protein [Bacteroidales bacterium]|nr:four helix bundle protein [Bacteroidales bacterium]